MILMSDTVQEIEEYNSNHNIYGASQYGAHKLIGEMTLYISQWP